MTHRDERPPLTVVDPPFDPDYDTPPTNHSGGGGGNNGGGRPPQDRDAERAVLAALVNEPDAATHLSDQLDSDDFFFPVHAQIWDAWHQLHDTNGTPPDAVLLNAHLIQGRDADAARTLTDLLNAGQPGLGLSYARIVRDAARLRVVDTLATGLKDIVNRAKLDNLEHYLGEGLQRFDETVMRLGPREHTADRTGLKDLAWVLDGQPPEVPQPTYCRRGDGTALFYPGKVNGVFGDPESAKTWLAQIAVVEALNAGDTAAMIDVDHNGPDHTAARLLLLGAHINHIADPEKFRYYEPEDGDELRAAINDITARRPHVLLIDSLGEIFPMLGVKTNEGDEITSAMRLVCTRPALAGACVITIDHLPKSTEARSTGFAIGSIAKKRMIRGSYLRAEARQQPAPGAVGRITLRIEKDTMGALRKSSGGGYAGTLVLDSTQPHITTWQIGREDTPKNDDGTFRPTVLMERISKFIEDNDQCNFTDIRDATGSKKEWVRDAVNVLVTEGFVARIDGARRAKLHHSIAPYRETEDDHVATTD